MMNTRNNNRPTRKQPSPAESGDQSGLSSSRRPVLFAGVTLLLAVSIATIYLLSTQGNNPAPVSRGGATATNTDTILTPQPTAVPPTEPPTEVAMQDQLQSWLGSMVGVTQVLSLDIDVPSDEAPLVYAEIAVSEGYNDTNIPDALVAKMNETLNTTQYSDFAVIMNDGSATIEYDFDSQNATWSQTVLSGNPFPEK
jgi:hypothetical protein